MAFRGQGGDVAACPHSQGDLEAGDDAVPGQGGGGLDGGGKGEAVDFDAGCRLDPGERPIVPGLPRAEADNYRLAVPVEDCPGNSLEVSNCQVHFWEVIFISTEDSNIINIAEAGLMSLAHTEAGQLSLEAAQQGLNVEQKEEHCQGVPLADGEEDEEREGQFM
jgi:hypothetical protein